MKVIAEIGGISSIEVTFWYNMAPKFRQMKKTVPKRLIFIYEWKYLSDVQPNKNEEVLKTIQIEDVFHNLVKLSNTQYTKQ